MLAKRLVDPRDDTMLNVSIIDTRSAGDTYCTTSHLINSDVLVKYVNSASEPMIDEQTDLSKLYTEGNTLTSHKETRKPQEKTVLLRCADFYNTTGAVHKLRYVYIDHFSSFNEL